MRNRDPIIFKSMRINDMNLNSVGVTLLPKSTPFPYDGLIGGTVFSQCVVCIDFKKEMIFWKSVDGIDVCGETL